MTDSLKGYVEHIIYRNDENGYTVLSLESEDGEVVVVGSFSSVSEGEYLEAERERQQRILDAVSAGGGEHRIQEQKAVRRLRRIGDLLREMN